MWTADGTHLVFVRWQARGVGMDPTIELWAVARDGSGATRVGAALDPPANFANGSGYYGSFGWEQGFALAPG